MEVSLHYVICILGIVLVAKFGGAHLLIIFGYDWLWYCVFHPRQFLFLTVLFARFLLGHVYFCFVLFVYFLDMVSCFVLVFIYVCTYGVGDTLIWYSWLISIYSC